MIIDINVKKLKKIFAFGLTLSLAVVATSGYAILRSEHGYEAGRTKVTASESAGTTNWGLSFQKEGEAPKGNASQKELLKYNAYYLGNTSSKTLYLTFDAGFENGYTSDILDVLKEEKVPAAFFLVGTYIKENKDLVSRMVKEGHLVGNHTMHHPDISKIAEKAAFEKELSDVETLFEEATGKKMKKFYRPPQGKFNFENLANAKELGYRTIFWSLAYVDWYENKQPTKEEAFDKLIPRTHNGSIILLHSTSKTNAEVLGELIKKWKSEGYKFKSVTELGKGA